jgi:membrane protein required for colicin V production
VTAFDYAVLAIAGASLLLGLWRGLVSEMLALAAWVVAFFASRAAAAEVGSVFVKIMPDATARYVVGFAVVFLGVLVIFAVLRLALRGVLAAAGLGVLDSILGAAFGAARAIVLLAALILVGGLTKLPQEPWWRESLTAQPLEEAVVASKPYLPEVLAKRIKYR